MRPLLVCTTYFSGQFLKFEGLGDFWLAQPKSPVMDNLLILHPVNITSWDLPATVSKYYVTSYWNISSQATRSDQWPLAGRIGCIQKKYQSSYLLVIEWYSYQCPGIRKISAHISQRKRPQKAGGGISCVPQATNTVYISLVDWIEWAWPPINTYCKINKWPNKIVDPFPRMDRAVQIRTGACGFDRLKGSWPAKLRSKSFNPEV